MQQRRGARETQKRAVDLRAILRYTGLLAALGSVVAGIWDSCSGYAGFWPCLLASAPRRQGNAKTRVDQRSTWILRYTGVLAALGSVVAGVRDSCSGYAGFWPCLLASAPRRQGNAKTRLIYARFCVILGFWRCWALSWPESGIAVPATLVSGLGEFVSSADTLPKHIVRSSLKFETEGFGDTLF